MAHDLLSLDAVSRRGFLAASAGTALLLPRLTVGGLREGGPYQATGTRVGEVTDSSAIVWTRLTRHAQRNHDGVVIGGRVTDRQNFEATNTPRDEIEGACPGSPGRIRVRYGNDEELSDAVATPWSEVDATTDFIHQFALTGLKPGTRYYYASEATAAGETSAPDAFRGQFETAPRRDTPSDLRFCVMTCQGYPDRDHADGHPIYPAMLALDPKFITMTGDLVYYDSNEPRAVNPGLARLHWERMFSLPRLMEAMRSCGTYWLKDDHDTLINDTWPGMNAGELTFEEGQKIFRQQAPLGDAIYRTFRWGRDLQVWLTDGRDFRSPNDIPDGPDKTIWGAEQKAWFKQTVAESDATWKVLISPTPLVGPDRPGKNDNHSNSGFTHEGNELRAWLQEHAPDNFFVVCGDRHWQYHSVHPTTGVQEFSAGPASNSHASGTPGENREYHRFHKVQGGFLCVEVRPEGNSSRISLQLRNVNGDVSHRVDFERSVI